MADPRRKPDLTIAEKTQVAQFLILRSQNGVLQRGTRKEAIQKFGFSRTTIYNIWVEAKQQMQGGEPVIFQSKKKGIQHRDRLTLDEEKVKSLSVLERSSIRKMAPKIGVSKTTLTRWIQSKHLKPHTNAIKPQLSEANKLSRLKFSLSHLKFDNQARNAITFEDMRNTIHIDEKWFYLTKTSDRYYLLPSEDEPYRSCQSKRFITKVMFMCAVARPQFDSDGVCTFDGKIGIFPFIMKEPAKRNSKNRDKGTLETKPIQSITKDVIKACIINQNVDSSSSFGQIIPAIKAKWPSTSSKNIVIQQDNAKPHISSNDAEFMAAANSDGFRMQLICQPPNSPDTNINDLGFFRAIQSLQDDKPAKNVDDLVKNVESAFEELSAQTLNNVFLTLQGCYAEILTVKGGNNYKIPHINKARISRLGILPDSIQVEVGLVQECVDYLKLVELDTGSSYDLTSVWNYFGRD
ncbi:uncharacterized protein LOC131009762 [Salvia miltiorrhiza]|uniref:uncharacterized protein LOC131009762 n=1 Tax=Salvia miltiorrhiza TaxID=226208 RepID=UPI0025AC7E32|nr:uncharacterized protein LOC131009762 [Salvia miltiorrhiza]